MACSLSDVAGAEPVECAACSSTVTSRCRPYRHLRCPSSSPPMPAPTIATRRVLCIRAPRTFFFLAVQAAGSGRSSAARLSSNAKRVEEGPAAAARCLRAFTRSKSYASSAKGMKPRSDHGPPARWHAPSPRVLRHASPQLALCERGCSVAVRSCAPPQPSIMRRVPAPWLRFDQDAAGSAKPRHGPPPSSLRPFESRIPLRNPRPARRQPGTSSSPSVRYGVL